MPNCLTCKQSFIIEPDDREFYAKLNVPEPTHCPACRQQSRLAWRSERSLFYRPCDLCKKMHLSAYRANSPYRVYCLDCWYSDKWDQLEHGRDFDFSRPFFEQFHDIRKLAPRPSLFVTQGTIVNSDYCNAVTDIKSCYLIFSAFTCEDCYYCNFIRDSFNLMDCTEVYHSERCFDCVNCDQSYNLIASDNCKGCRDSAFLFDCSGCSDCFGCANLRNQKFCLWNKQLSEDDYKIERAKINLASRRVYAEMKKKYDELKQRAVHKYAQGFNNLECTGDYLTRCKNARASFDCYEVEDSKYVTRLTGSQDCYDVDHFGHSGTEQCYSSVSIGTASKQLKFCTQVWENCYNVEYSDMCQKACSDCFGCVSLSHKKHCILNQQYTPEKYAALKDKIIAHMRATGEYGQWFPPAMAYCPYNDTLAQDYYPLTKATAEAKGFIWADDEQQPQPASCALPDTLTAEHDLTKETFVCEMCGKNYRLAKQELELNSRMSVPLPEKCFQCRILDRLHRKNPRALYDRTCSHCSKPIQSSYAPNRPERVYCEECYQKEIY
ncbi:hypothetical protein HY933_02030 [Candidatus Falkowbacteria bacterium]|nr:hypothetical protein [Candidatus Falkowbacteria bacterium]